LAGEKRHANGTKTLRFHAEDVIDFAWTASPRFLTEESQWQQRAHQVVLLQPEHAAQAGRYLDLPKPRWPTSTSTLAATPIATSPSSTHPCTG
jgi:hypothetical protein